MRMLFLSLLVALGVSTAPRAAMAFFFDGYKLCDWCNVADEGSNKSMCTGFIGGVVDGQSNLRDLSGVDYVQIGELKYCRPGSVTMNQIANIVLKYLIDTPEKRHFSAAGLIFFAMVRAFPCPE